ncbi:Filamentous Growth Regulator [Neonectria punicea]|uniref:Filamentous Growth Regulator n=1 Tax=Neonectria punicea TaxID=979145 RepID=A0ABR1GZ88_9HYPO
MSTPETPAKIDPVKGGDAKKDVAGRDDISYHAASHVGITHELGNVTDPVLTAKTHLVNEAINEIGWTGFHLKLSCLTGFGFAADSLVAFLQSVATSQAYLEIGNGGYPTGFSADIIGRRIAFNTTLFIAAVATVVAGTGPNWIGFCVFVAFLGFGVGGNLVLDPTVMLEFVPAKQQWVITAMAGWWGVGQATAGFIAWGYCSLSARTDWTCVATVETYTWQNNKSWRLIMFTGGSVMLIISILRLLVVRLPETPKFLVTSGREEELVSMLQSLASKYRRPCSLTAAQLQACGSVIGSEGDITRYPLFFLYLPSLLSSRIPGYQPSFTETWRDYTITNVCSIFGPLVAAGLAEVPLLGRRYTMTIGALLTAVFFFGYTVIKTPAQNLAMSCCISVCFNLYYGTLYAYTAEVFPSAHRTTGNGIAVSLSRVMGLISAVIAVTADTATVTPLYISAALFLILAVVSVILPFEPYGRSAS